MTAPKTHIWFRTDASVRIGTGHVMRCLTLANTLADHGCNCHFICSNAPGNLVAQIRWQGFDCHLIPVADDYAVRESRDPSTWLPLSEREDADATLSLIGSRPADMIIVDHYAISRTWEELVRSKVATLMVIDDLADRTHACDVLLDQNAGRVAADYDQLLPAGAERLIGSDFAMLRPEFLAWREPSRAYRRTPSYKHVLVSMGGVDQDNVTGSVLEVLHNNPIDPAMDIRVILGPKAPWYREVMAQAASLSSPCTVLQGITTIAEEMSKADVMIGAAGSTSWERCCLGLPSIVMPVADNQIETAQHLDRLGVAMTCAVPSQDGHGLSLSSALALLSDPETRDAMSARALSLVDGKGAERVARHLLDILDRHQSFATAIPDPQLGARS